MFSSRSFRGLRLSMPCFTLHMQVVQKPFPPQACSIGMPLSSAIWRMVWPSHTSTVFTWPFMWNETFGIGKPSVGKYARSGYHGSVPYSPLLAISGLRIAVDGKEVAKGVNLSVGTGEIHAIMGPNGSGKSTLVNTLMGHPKYEVTSGEVRFAHENLLTMRPDERASAGLFLAFQYPKEIAGVTLRSFLFAARSAQMTKRDPSAKKLSPIKFKILLEEKMRELSMDPSFAERFVNQGFSGGEKKKAEVLQMSILRPRLALMDETDSGLDIDALKVVADGVNNMRSPDFSAVIVTHYARLLQYITPDHVHVMIDGRIVESGGMELAMTLEREGYVKHGVREAADALPLQAE
ncbi:MAG: Fe-S cluster assembly ATP-binding protein [Candidatus Peregrinibacteria bacterium Greene0416_19]|nr:MAG: Fe-S cluster assembly ATP-binding protein [Candidatus Peregrinibacteria bacterium Greene0416_19]